MTLLIVIRYLHFIAALFLFSAVFTENILIKRILTKSEIARLARIDLLYGIASIVVVAAGLTLWLGIGKPTEFYHNWIFYTKLSLLAILGILSIYPTVFFIKNRTKSHPESPIEVSVPYAVYFLIRLELVLLIIIPVLASMMANGIGKL